MGIYGCAFSATLSILCGIIQCYPTGMVEWMVIIVGFVVFIGLHYYYLCLTSRIEDISICGFPRGREIEGRFKLVPYSIEQLERVRNEKA